MSTRHAPPLRVSMLLLPLAVLLAPAILICAALLPLVPLPAEATR